MKVQISSAAKDKITMIEKTIRITLAAHVLAAIASAQDVTYNFDAAARFSDFKTYKWVEIPGGVKLDDLLSRQLDSAAAPTVPPTAAPMAAPFPQTCWWPWATGAGG